MKLTLIKLAVVGIMTCLLVLVFTSNNFVVISKEFKKLMNISTYSNIAMNQNSSNLSNFLTKQEKIYAARRDRVKTVCNALKDFGVHHTDYSDFIKHFYWLETKNISVCLNPKVGSLTWRRYLFEDRFPDLIDDQFWKDIVLEKIRDIYSTEEAVEKLKYFTKIVIVRHPFERLLSTYKFMFKHMFQRFTEIIKRRNISTSTNDPSFKDFVSYLVQAYTPNFSIKSKHPENGHWYHYYVHCALCNIDYDVIAKKETIHADTKYIIEKYKLNITTTEWRHVADSSTESEVKGLFKDLPKNLTYALYENYKMDFLLFNYTYEDYLGDN